ncbi:hypothetical protein GT354_06260 [Streptomyces sp. SID3343]|nr:hypothetical protein [Streptomyces sp. SID3343]
MSRTVLVRRSSAAVTEILTSPPEPPLAVKKYVPEPCGLVPEQDPHWLDQLAPGGTTSPATTVARPASRP